MPWAIHPIFRPMANNSNSGVPWLRRTIEVVAIIASILIAFAIDAWWQGRLEEDEVEQILVSLQREFETHGLPCFARSIRTRADYKPFGAFSYTCTDYASDSGRASCSWLRHTGG